MATKNNSNIQSKKPIKKNSSRARRSFREKIYPILKWIQRAGIASELFGWAGLVIVGWFWPAVIIIYLGFILIAIDLWFERDLFKYKWFRVVGLIIILVFTILFSIGIVFVPAPLTFSTLSINAEYPPGTVKNGIKWRSEYQEVNIGIENPTSNNYEDLNLLINTDFPIVKITQENNICSDITFEDVNSFEAHQILKNNTSGESTVNPLILIATDAPYRVRCSKLPAGGTIKLALTIADIIWNPSEFQKKLGIFDPNYLLRIKMSDFHTYWYGHQDGNFFTPRISPQWVKIEGQYTCTFKKHTISERKEITIIK